MDDLHETWEQRVTPERRAALAVAAATPKGPGWRSSARRLLALLLAVLLVVALYAVLLRGRPAPWDGVVRQGKAYVQQGLGGLDREVVWGRVMSMKEWAQGAAGSVAGGAGGASAGGGGAGNATCGVGEAPPVGAGGSHGEL